MLERHGVDPAEPSVVFVGRITRQKGVPHLLAAARDLDPGTQLVLLAGAPDTPELGAEVEQTRRRAAGGARGRGLDRRHAPARRDPAVPHPRDGVRLPVGLRAAGHREPRGDGLRDRGGRERGRRHPRGRGRRRDRAARPVRRRCAARVRAGARRRAQRGGRAIRTGPPPWAAPVASGRRPRSPGRRSPTRPSRSTARSPNDHVSAASGAVTRRIRRGKAQAATETWSLGGVDVDDPGLGRRTVAEHGLEHARRGRLGRSSRRSRPGRGSSTTGTPA